MLSLLCAPRLAGLAKRPHTQTCPNPISVIDATGLQLKDGERQRMNDKEYRIPNSTLLPGIGRPPDGRPQDAHHPSPLSISSSTFNTQQPPLNSSLPTILACHYISPDHSVFGFPCLGRLQEFHHRLHKGLVSQQIPNRGVLQAGPSPFYTVCTESLSFLCICSVPSANAARSRT